MRSEKEIKKKLGEIDQAMSQIVGASGVDDDTFKSICRPAGWSEAPGAASSGTGSRGRRWRRGGEGLRRGGAWQ